MRQVGRISHTRVCITLLLLVLFGAARRRARQRGHGSSVDTAQRSGGVRVEVVYGTGFAFRSVGCPRKFRTEIQVSWIIC